MRTGRRRRYFGPVAGALALWLAQLAGPARALAHDGAPIAPHDLWLAWNFDPLILANLLIPAVLFGRGAGRFRELGRPLAWWRPAAFYLALFAAAVALISPLDALSGALFSAHMVQHLLLIMVTAPLVGLAAPLAPMLRGLPRGLQTDLGQARSNLQAAHRVLGVLGYGWVAWLAHTAAVWLWHLPGPYQAALTNGLVHALEHIVLVGTGIWYWSAVIPRSARRREAGGWAFLSVFAMAVQGSVLGALMTFSPQPWYPAYAATTGLWGLTPLEDQQAAGVLMWVPPGLIYTGAALALFGAWLRGVDGNGDRGRQDASSSGEGLGPTPVVVRPAPARKKEG